VSELLKNSDIESLLERFPRHLVVDAIREVLEEYRSALLNSTEPATNRSSDAARTAGRDVVPPHSRRADGDEPAPRKCGRSVHPPHSRRADGDEPDPEDLGPARNSSSVNGANLLDSINPRAVKKRGNIASLRLPDIVEAVKERLRRLTAPSLRPVINATGIPLHTNLGRAPLSDQAAQAMYEAARNYVNLELDLESGKRGSRQAHLLGLLTRLTGAEDALVVNNNAAAVLLCLNTLSEGREVIVSRGELVEIGGSFRLPDIMRRSGATLVEVGTTNRTYVRDYADAITDRTALILRVHPSNFALRGYTHRVLLRDLVALAHERGIAVLNDAGGGALFRTEEHGLPPEPFIPDEVSAGSDLVTFSGDKLLGGPQAGIIVGKRDLISRIKNNPLYRAVRVDKVVIAGLEATLRTYLTHSGETTRGALPPPSEYEVPLSIPIMRMLLEDSGDVRSRAETLASALTDVAGRWFSVSVEDGVTEVGGGSLPLAEIPTSVVKLSPRADRPRLVSVNRLSSLLRSAVPPVISRICEESVILDAKTIREEQIPAVTEAMKSILAKEPSGSDS